MVHLKVMTNVGPAEALSLPDPVMDQASSEPEPITEAGGRKYKSCYSFTANHCIRYCLC